MKTIYISTILVFVLCSAHAQRNVMRDTLVWTSNKDVDIKSGQSFERAYTFFTYGGSAFEMKYGAGVMRFEIVRTIGNWVDVETNGGITYKVKLEGDSGIIAIKRVGSELSIVVDLREAMKDGFYRKFIIDNYTQKK